MLFSYNRFFETKHRGAKMHLNAKMQNYWTLERVESFVADGSYFKIQRKYDPIKSTIIIMKQNYNLFNVQFKNLQYIC